MSPLPLTRAKMTKAHFCLSPHHIFCHWQLGQGLRFWECDLCKSPRETARGLFSVVTREHQTAVLL